jgi:hypothetical protein
VLEERMLQTARRVQSRTPLDGLVGAARRMTGARFTNSLDVWPRLPFSGHADASGGSTLAVRGAPAPQLSAFLRPRVVGCLRQEAIANPVAFTGLRGKVLPLQMTGGTGGPLEVRWLLPASDGIGI